MRIRSKEQHSVYVLGREKLTLSLAVLIVFFCNQIVVTKLSILTEYLAPFQIVSKYSIKGLSRKIVEATLKESQYAYSIEAYPWPLPFSRAKHGKIRVYTHLLVFRSENHYLNG